MRLGFVLVCLTGFFGFAGCGDSDNGKPANGAKNPVKAGTRVPVGKPGAQTAQPQEAQGQAALEQDSSDSGGAQKPWYIDRAAELGLNGINRTGEEGKKQFIMSAVGPGVATFDANGDGRMDIYSPNGNRLMPPRYDKLYAGEDRPLNALYIQQPDGSFRDEASERGVACDRWGFGACSADVDNDGDADLIVTNLQFNRLYLNDGTGHFRDVAVEAGIAGDPSDWSTGIAVGDFNRDGIPDLYISNYADMFEGSRTYKGIKRGLKGEVLKATVCVWQRLDVYCGPLGLPAQQDHLYLGLGLKDGVPRYKDVSKESGIFRPGKVETSRGPGYGFQPIFADMNGDGWPDLFVANDSVPSFYFENRKDGTFLECGESRGIALSTMGDFLAGMGADIGDLNGDGHADLLKTNFALQTYNIYVGEPFKGTMYWQEWSVRTGLRQAVYSGLGWGALYFDFDNDGDQDVFFANGHVYPEVDSVPELGTRFKQANQLIRNDFVPSGKLKLRDVSADAGPGLAVVESSRGSAYFDCDNDGDLDILVMNMNTTPSLLVNQRGNANGRWLQIRLVGDPARKVTREAIHAKVRVTGAAGTQHRQVARGRGFLGCSDPRMHFGLGQKPGVVTIDIEWPNGDAQQIKTDKLDRILEIRQE